MNCEGWKLKGRKDGRQENRQNGRAEKYRESDGAEIKGGERGEWAARKFIRGWEVHRCRKPGGSFSRRFSKHVRNSNRGTGSRSRVKSPVFSNAKANKLVKRLPAKLNLLN